MRRLLAIPLGAFCVGCISTDPVAPLGSIANPVNAHDFRSEVGYLSSLRCPDGTRPHFQGLPRRPRRLIGYRVRCIYLNREVQIYFDPLRSADAAREAVPGFSLAISPNDGLPLEWLR